MYIMYGIIGITPTGTLNYKVFITERLIQAVNVTATFLKLLQVINFTVPLL